MSGWLHTEINVRHRELNPDTVAHLSTNRARRRLTSLIEANALTTASLPRLLLPTSLPSSILVHRFLALTTWSKYWSLRRFTIMFLRLYFLQHSCIGPMSRPANVRRQSTRLHCFGSCTGHASWSESSSGCVFWHTTVCTAQHRRIWLRLRAGFNWWEAWGQVYLGGTGRLQQLYD